jgi:PAS domain S-box-containing protein
MRIIPYKTTEGNVEGVVITFTDITEKKKQELELQRYQNQLENMVQEKSKALIESEERHKKVSAASSDYSYSHVIDAEGNLTLEWYFGAFERITGYKPEEMVTPDEISKLIHPEDFPKVQERLTRILKGETVISELRIITKSGEMKWIRDKGVPEWDQIKNRVVRSIGTATEITERKEIEQELIESEKKFRNIAENVPGLVLKYKLYPDGTDELLYLSKTVEEIYEIPYEMATNNVRLLWDRIHKDDLEAYTKSIEESAKNLSFWEREHRIQMPDGRVKWLLGRAVPTNLPDGSVVWDTLGIDITEKKEISVALERSELKFKEIFNSTSDAIVLHDDITGTIVECNDVTVQMYGAKSKNDLINKSVGQFSAINKGYDENAIARNTAKAIRQGSYTFEWLAKKKDGSEFWVEVNLKKTLIDQHARILAVVRDIDERKKGEQKIIESERLFRSLFEESPSAILLADDEGNYLEANAAAEKMFGYSQEEFTRMKVADLKTISGPKADEWYNKYIQSGKESGEFGYYDKYGSPKYILYNATRIKPNLNVSILSDITQRKKMEKDLLIAKQQAEESDKLKSAFLANMSHEIRTPMNGIIGFTNLLQKPDLREPQSNKYLELIDKSGKRLLNTINDIIRISKIESNQEKVTLSKFSLFEFMNELYEFFQHEAKMKALNFMFQPKNADKSIWLNTDREKLYSVLTNLITNAFKYTPDGEVFLGYDMNKETVKIYVKDTGIGIPSDKQEAIFNRFERIDENNRASTEGSGLGLSIVKAYLEMLGSSVSLESEPNVGTTFYFELPYFKEEVNKNVDRPHSLDDRKGKFKNQRILIVDDDNTSLSYLEAILKDSFKDIYTANDGLEAVETIKKFPKIDFILMDIKMPQLNGFEATRKIRTFNKDVRIIAQTAFALEGDREKALAAGCNDYIAKPVDESRLYELLQKQQEQV